jgi:hypothetical protein
VNYDTPVDGSVLTSASDIIDVLPLWALSLPAF